MKEFKDKLSELLKEENEPKVIAIKGDWGSGKSTFLKDFTKEKDNYPYVSLYGLNSIADIENSILLQISELNIIENFVEKKLKFLHDIQILGVNAKAVLSSLKPSSFKKLVICLDDFERLSNKITVNELFGFIADLKENKQCKVVIILNEDKISQKNKDDFDIQKEKVIDYELFFKTILSDIKNKDIKVKLLYKEYLFEFIEKFEVQNIRTVNKIIYILNDFIDKLDNDSLDNKIMKNIFEKMIEISFVYYQFNFKDFELFQEYKSKQTSNMWNKFLKKDNVLKTNEQTTLKVEETKKFLEDNKELQVYVKYLQDFKLDDLQKNIINFLTKHELYKDFFNNYIRNEKFNIENNNLRSQLNEIINRYKYDFNHSLEKYDNELFNFLIKYKENILKLKNFETIKIEIEKCKQISNKEYNGLLIDMQKSYLKDYKYINYHENIDHDTNYDQIIKENNPKVMDYLKSLIEYNKNPTAEEIIEIFKKTINTQLVISISEENTVNKLSEVKIKEFILTNQKFIKIVFDNFDRHGNFSKFKEKLSKVFEDLKSNKKYRLKIENLME